MKLKRILEDFHFEIPGIDSAVDHKHDEPLMLQHAEHLKTIKDPSVYYIDNDYFKDDKGIEIPKNKTTGDDNFKLYDVGGDGILDQKDLAAHIKKLSEKHNVPLNVIQAIINKESGWNPNAVGQNSSSSDLGLMQLNSRYLDSYVEKYWNHDGIKFDPKNPFHNAELGVAYLQDLHKMVKDNKWWEKTIMAYNIGPTAVNKGLNLEAGKKYLASIATMMHSKKLGLPKDMFA